MSRCRYLISTLVLLCATRAALAQDAPNEIRAERADPPFDRGTELRLTGSELAARGAVDLGSALALLPDVMVRSDGRGGMRVEVRGARDGAVNVFIDGVLAPDPYGGTFDVSAIPITDIVQIRVSTTPQSPIDGIGGAGGVIEVHTRDAIGPQLVMARVTAASLPSVGMTGTTRVALARRLGLRLSVSGIGGARELELLEDAQLAERRRAATAGARLEYRDGDRRIVVDGAFEDRRHVAPSNTVLPGTILLVDRETAARVSATVEDRIGALQLQGRVWSQYVNERARYFVDPALTMQSRIERVKAVRSGVMALASRPFLRDFRWTGSITLDFEKAATASQPNEPNEPARSHTTLFATAGAAQYARGPLRAEIALGVVVPFLASSVPWPEGKAVAGYRLRGDLELTATLAYKGRVPSMRELFDRQSGNPRLDPERITHAELRAIEHVTDAVHLELAPFYRRATDTIRGSTESSTFGQKTNLGAVSYGGVDAQARVTAMRGLEAGAGYGFIRPSSNQLADAALDVLPRHRWDAWVEGRPERRLRALGRVAYASRAQDRGRRLGSYVLVEASVAAQLAPAYAAVLRVDDLLDARPQTRVGEPAAGRVVSLAIQATWQ
jgi:outer membrane cobalamin receptor